MAGKLVCVAGPTATGKTRLGVLLAKRYNGEVISADSMQLYRGMAVGTAAPTEEEKEGIPHHMIGVADPGESYSVARYAAEASACAEDILARAKLPILVGGTGLYLDAVVRGHGFAAGSEGGETRRQLQKRLREEGIGPLLRDLWEVDPVSAEKLPPADEKRILRALEVYRETGKTITAHNEETKRLPPRYEAVYLGLAFRDREDLRRRIDLRVDEMMRQGLLDEVRALVSAGVPRNSTALQAIGYKELLGALDGAVPLPEAVEEVKLRSRQYAKRQLTWLRRNPSIHWILWEKEYDFARAMQISTEILSAEGLR